MSAAPSGGPPRGVAAMSIVRWVLVGLAAIAAAVSIASYVRARQGTPAGQGGHAPTADALVAGAGAVPARRSTPLYYCPMHVSVVQDHPGECPICSMTLVPKPDGPAAPAPAGPSPLPGLAEVDLSPDRVQLIGMRTATVKREALGVELRAVGVVVPSERGLAQVSPRFAGWIQQLLVSETGARVRRGQTLALVYSPEVLRAQEELLVARGWSASGRDRGGTGTAPGTPSVTAPAAGLDADARRRLELLGVATSEIDEVLRRGKALDAVPLRSPVDGTVVAKAAVAGGAVQPGTVLFEVADLSLVWVNVEIPEQDLGRVHVGQKAHFELTAFPGEAHEGKVQLISPLLDTSARTLRVRIELRNRVDRDGPRLRPGMSGAVRFDPPARSAATAAPPALVVPAEAVVDTGQARYVFVAKPGGHFEPRPVKVGARSGDLVEVLSGLAEGETVVTTGNFLLDSESRLRAALAGAGAGAKSDGK